MHSYDPSRITCNETTADPPFEDECEKLVSVMPASSGPLEIFGPRGSSSVTEILPYTLAAPRQSPMHIVKRSLIIIHPRTAIIG